MTIYRFPRIVSLVRDKNVKLHLSTCKVVITQAGRMVLVAPTFGQGLWGSFREEKGTERFGVFSPNRSFFSLPQDQAKFMLEQLGLVEDKGLEAVKSISKLTGNCCICGRTLTAENSIEEGIGPICSGKLEGAW